MRTTLTKAFDEFLDDLANVSTIDKTLYKKTHDEVAELVKNELGKKTNEITFLDIGKIYPKSNDKTKHAILSHLNNLKLLAEESPSVIEPTPPTTDELSLLLPKVLTEENRQRIANVVSRNNSNENIVDILKNIVNSKEFEEIAKDITQTLKL